jgi:hypothetical protein
LPECPGCAPHAMFGGVGLYSDDLRHSG